MKFKVTMRFDKAALFAITLAETVGIKRSDMDITDEKLPMIHLSDISFDATWHSWHEDMLRITYGWDEAILVHIKSDGIASVYRDGELIDKVTLNAEATFQELRELNTQSPQKNAAVKAELDRRAGRV